MRNSFGRSHLEVLAATTAMIVGGSAVAAEDGQLEEIIVTAQKRAENLQTVPLALSAYTADFLENQNVASLTDLKFRVPSLVYDEFTAGQPRYYIRGIGNNLQSGSVDEDVGVFIDGVYMGRPELTNNDFLDLERVEVLRGPQGTLFGRNVVGGAISFNTRKPDDEIRAGGNITVGNYDQRDIGAYVSGPLSEKLFGKVAYTSRNHDGYYYNTTTDNDVEDSQFSGARAALRYVPNDSLDIQLNADASRRRGTGSWALIVVPGPVFSAPEQPDPYHGAHDPNDGSADVDNAGGSLSIDWTTSLGTFTSITAYRTGSLDSAFNTTGHFARQIGDPDPSHGSNLRYIQGYQSDTTQFSQELRLASPAADRFNWVAGLYYFDTDVDYLAYADYRFVDFFAEADFGIDSTSKTTAYAAFANATFNFTDAWAVQGGLRWSRDEKRTRIQTLPGGIPFTAPSYTVDGVPTAGYDVTASKSWDAVTPTLSLNYKASPDLFFYATASRGFKSGGFASGIEATEARAAQVPFDPEYAWNYEIGSKAEFIDRRLRLNLSAFYIDYTDLQLRILLQVAPLPSLPSEVIDNAGSAVSQGVEAEWQFMVTPTLSLFGSYTYLDTEIKEMTLASLDAQDLAGHELAKAPHHKVFAGGQYTLALNDSLEATFRADYSYTTKYHSNPTNDPVELVALGRNLNAGISLAGKGGRWQIELWGKNLTDEFHPSTITSVFGTGYAVPIDPPRTYGVTVRVEY